MWNGADWNMWGMGFGIHWIFFAAFWGLIFWAAIGIYRSFLGKRGGHRMPPQSALDILKIRYARGELSGEEFARMRETLGPTGI